jgi:Tol biopolymer transport system component
MNLPPQQLCRIMPVMRLAILLTVCSCFIAGCASEFNRTPTTGEIQALDQIVALTSNFDRAGEAYFSPDMRWIVFQARPAGEAHDQMYLAQLRSGGAGINGIGTPIRISPQGSWNSCGYFSPNGNSLIFASSGDRPVPEGQSGYQREGGNYRWFSPAEAEIYRADGWQGAIAAAEPGGITNLARYPITKNDAYDAECAFSPDGKWIIRTSNRTGDLELFAMHPDGSDNVQLTHTPGYDGGAFFSPDGKRIVFRSDRKRKDYLQIHTADLTFDALGNIAGIGNDRELTHDLEVVNWAPFWHPDGRHIIYASSGREHRYDLWVMRADGSGKTRITFDPNADLLPAISPDGKYLLWTSRRNGQSSQVYIARFRLPRGA